MGFNNKPMDSGIDYPGKTADIIKENQEKKDLISTKETSSDYNSIKMAEGKSPLHPDNAYNSPEADEAILEARKKFVTGDDIVDQTEDDIVNALSEKMDRERASIDVNDPYGFTDIIDKLFESANQKMVGKEKGDRKEINKILDSVSSFIIEYKNILKQNLSDEEEEIAVKGAFKTIIGDVAYINVSKDGKLLEQVELLSKRVNVQNARPGSRKGQKIYYAGNSKIGYLSQAEANAAASATSTGKNKKENSWNWRSIFNKNKGRDRKDENLVVYDTQTGKNFKIDNRK